MKRTALYEKTILVCCNRKDEPSCARDTDTDSWVGRMRQYLVDNGLGLRAWIIRSGCMGRCRKGPNVMVFPENDFYEDVKEEDIEEIIRTHLEPMKAR